ncbi:hypothetical protein CARUB_v10021424mg [Capsella rubella]|uniref:Uncharacterized protein n=1 Tax=Capsella rubella TaxID=81985 RepID=R0GE76_9BRAS|nr:uncharacterized protein LOC17896265 [Capsella rubella]EOA33931.1 hypothetical protein CARUB_v10021424mg [Capsella rubella]
MKKITKKLSMKYVKLNKNKLRKEESMKLEEDGRELFQENYALENAENNETKETPKVTKVMESMQRKLTLKEKDQLERSVRNGGRARKDQLDEGLVRNTNLDVGSVKYGHMDHLEDLIKGRDRIEHIEGSTRNVACNGVDKLEGSSKNKQKHQREANIVKPSDQVDQSEKSTKCPSDFASKKDYIDWIEYVEGSNHHCFDRSENSNQSYKKEDIDRDQMSVAVSEGSIEGNNEEILLLNNSKNRKNEKFDDLKGYKKGRGSKVKDSSKFQIVD